MVAKAKPKQADTLIRIAREEALLFHSPDDSAWATVNVNGHEETWAIRSGGFKRWITHLFFQEQETSPSPDALSAALNVLDGIAHYDGPEHPVYVRVAEHDDRFYLDMADAGWRAIEISERGWRLIDKPPVRFRRTAGTLPLSVPERGGRIEQLRPFVNVANDDDFVLTVSYIVAALRPRGPYPVMGLNGEHGSAKSTLARVVRSLIDPNEIWLRRLPRNEQDFHIAASNGHLLVFDNLSSLTDWVSDVLSVLATGGGFAARKLYSDGDEKLFNAIRPTLLTGIVNPITRADLADRALFLTLEPIAREKRRIETEFWREFDHARPRIFGALLSAMVHGLKRLPTTKLIELPRMADFAVWAAACETAYAEPGAFMQSYDRTRAEAIEATLSASHVVTALRSLMADRDEWEGLLKRLYEELSDVAGKRITEGKEWPRSERGLRGELIRMAAFLRAIGITIEWCERTNKGRPLKICKQPSPPSDRHDRPQKQGSGDGGDGGDGDSTSLEDGDPDGPDAWQDEGETHPPDDDSDPQFEARRCAQCNAPADVRGPLDPHRDEERHRIVWLHRECKKFWLRQGYPGP